jgi:hypothetical protein
MKSTLRTGAALLSLALMAGGGAALAAEHGHGEEAHGPARLQLNKGKKWETDAPLRQSMANLRASLGDKLEAIHKGKLSAEDAQALGAKIDTEVGTIVAQCKLEPQADAMLHLVIADLLGSAEVMQGKHKGVPVAAARKAVGALNSYGRYFDDPQWKPLK